MKSAVLVFPGINRERDMARALRLVSRREPSMVWHAETVLPSGTDLVVIPGGFSYGDDIASGKILANQIVHHLGAPLRQWIADGKLHYNVDYSGESTIDINQLDLQRTVDENAKRGVRFTLKPQPNTYTPSGDTTSVPSNQLKSTPTPSAAPAEKTTPAPTASPASDIAETVGQAGSN